MSMKQTFTYKENLQLDLYLPEGESFDLFVYFHGGGLSRGSRGCAEAFANTLCKNGIAVVSVDYRLYPDAKFPDFIEDAADAVAWAKRTVACRRFFIGGSSAGGYLSMMLCFDTRYLKAVGVNPCEIDGYIHDAGQPTSHFNVLRERGEDSRRVVVDETAPVYFVGLEETYPPMNFIVSDGDMFGRYEQTMMTVKTLEHFGHKEQVFLTVMHGSHCEYVSKKDEDGEGVFGKLVCEFCKKIGEKRK